MDELTRRRAQRMLPPELFHFYHHEPERGHVIYCVLDQDLDEILITGDEGWQDYLLPIPLPYVIQHGYKVVDNLVVVEADYHEERGLLMDVRYVLHGPLTEESLNEKRQGRHQTGDRIEAFAGLPEGCRLTINENGLLLLLLLKSPDEEVMDQIGPGNNFQMHLVQLENALMLVSRFGVLNWMAAPYHPSLHSQPVHLQEVGDDEGYRLSIMAVDTTDGAIMSLRMIPLTTQFSRKFKHVHDKLKEHPVSYEEYQNTLEDVQSKNSVGLLIERSCSYFVSQAGS